jgi:hypothetical protein
MISSPVQYNVHPEHIEFDHGYIVFVPPLGLKDNSLTGK